MGWRRRPKFHGLKRFKARQTWNKYNLYNISRLQTPPAAPKTYFQQKWLAKSLTRAYHGEYIREGQWERMFNRHIPTVIPMNHRYLAQSDGSKEAAGRGSGEDPPPNQKVKEPLKIPYMQMVYGPIERRLDQAIFRSLFASSARQAKQFVTHGHVKVNGKKMVHPGYLLNPGDMFQVDTESVMTATGAPKDSAITTGMDFRRETEAEDARIAAEAEEARSTAEADAAAEEEAAIEEEDEPEDDAAAEAAATDAQKEIKSSLKSLRDRTKTILKDLAKDLSGKQKQALRAYTRTLRAAIARAASATPSTLDDLDTQFHTLTARIKHKDAATAPSAAADEPAPAPGTQDTPSADEAADPAFQAALQRASDNPIDPSKPYATPWRPRPFMSAFAFIPRYLEVNQNICAAVYLRHPVARPGRSEVPSPWGAETGQLAFNWYLKRR